MLSNLLVKSNVLPSQTYQRELKNLSAIDLHSITDRFRLLPISFAPNDPRLTPRQREEWNASLSWGNKTVSLSDDGRRTRWIEALGKECIENWEQYRQSLDEETAFEWLWILEAIRDFGTFSKQGKQIVEELKTFLRRQNFKDPDIQTRLASFNPLLSNV